MRKAKLDIMTSEPYQDGYVDFIQYDSLSSAITAPDPPRHSTLDDICFYFQHHYDKFQTESEPFSATIFLQKIIASQYTLFVEYLRALLSELEWRLAGQEISGQDPSKVEQAWVDMHSFNNRCSEYNNFVELILRQRQNPNRSAIPGWISCMEDFKAIKRDLAILKTRCDLLTASFTGLASMVGNRQSLIEARISSKLSRAAFFRVCAVQYVRRLCPRSKPV